MKLEKELDSIEYSDLEDGDAELMKTVNRISPELIMKHKGNVPKDLVHGTDEKSPGRNIKVHKYATT